MEQKVPGKPCEVRVQPLEQKAGGFQAQPCAVQGARHPDDQAAGPRREGRLRPSGGRRTPLLMANVLSLRPMESILVPP